MLHSNLPSISSLAAFLIASFVLAVTPGPGVLYIVTRSLSQGRGNGLASVAGVALGNSFNALGAALGLGALFALWSFAFTLVKWAGAGYLIALGVRTLWDAHREQDPAPGVLAPSTSRTAFRDGVIVATFNPKTALFFAAFLPQFLDPHAAALPQTMTLGILFVAIAAVTDTAYALGASVLRSLSGAEGSALGRRVRYLSGGLYIGLGVLSAATGTTKND